jgi:hypothetical protein
MHRRSHDGIGALARRDRASNSNRVRVDMTIGFVAFALTTIAFVTVALSNVDASPRAAPAYRRRDPIPPSHD